ncbi:MAG: ATPase [Zetaproteobacteria bacterium CG2_30_46_52]|nr:MAG: ATPase [Zetaproteobacteria bacterium CG2_30_46_52]
MLIAAAILSVAIDEWSDAGFITAVLLINALIGTIQEFSAQRSAAALHALISSLCKVQRDGETYEINARKLVPGDIIFLESGDRVPADIRLLNTHAFAVDESLLTGESEAAKKDAESTSEETSSIGDRKNMAFAGTLVASGRGQGVVTSIGFATELGRIAEEVLNKPAPKAPLLVRMEVFTRRIAIFVGGAALLMASVLFYQGAPLAEIFLLSVALAVSAIPEGLPVALTVALAIGMRRMAKRGVIIRRLVAVESLGSCTFIATDKTGTLTVNQLTVNKIVLPDATTFDVSGEGITAEGKVTYQGQALSAEQALVLEQICRAAVLSNEGFFGKRGEGWAYHGDMVDVAMLVMAHKAGVIKADVVNACPELADIPFESERLYSASLNQVDGVAHIFVKGAMEKLLPMCSSMVTLTGEVPMDVAFIQAQTKVLAGQGYRVILLASGATQGQGYIALEEEHLQGLTLLGLVGIIDPLRPEAKSAVASCRTAGIEVAMITGDHPATAFAIAKVIGLAQDENQVVTGLDLRRADSDAALDQLTLQGRVFARVEPQQKLQIVESLQRNGHFVAVSGDGANDAPALRAAQVGVAMGKSGTDVARETASIIITDDKFDSIVAGVEEGRVAYANVRKVILLLISTGAAELVLFTLSLVFSQPIPLLAVHLLWLNLVTNGIQDVALAFEPQEGDELKKKPRSPKEPIFNRLMIEQVLIAALVIGVSAFVIFQMLLAKGLSVDAARNSTLLLMVLFENMHVFNCRSETRSIFRHNPLRNPVLLFGTLAAQLIHIAAMYTPWLSDVLAITPVSFAHWLQLLGVAISILVVLEIYKWIRLRYPIVA